MDVQLLLVPYDTGHREARMGRGPRALATAIGESLRQAGHSTVVAEVRAPGQFPAEIRTAFDVCHALAESVRAARTANRFPLVLAGNCSTAIGTVSGIGVARTGVLWLDAHADLNTPDTSTSGFLDGTALAALTGRCWQRLASAIPGFSAVPDDNVALVGARDLDPAEHELLARSRLMRASPLELQSPSNAALTTVLSSMRERVDAVYLHIDLDVIDPSDARANTFAAPGGLTIAQVAEIARRTARELPVAAAAFTAYDPSCDPEGRIPAAAARIATELFSA